MIEIHPSAQVSRLADLEDSVRGTRIVVGAHSVIDSFVKVKPAAVVKRVDPNISFFIVDANDVVARQPDSIGRDADPGRNIDIED